MSAEYGADQIQILEGLEAVRKRPGMYIGSTSSRGLHHLVYEIVDNSVDEALAGYCDHIQVFINPDNSITVIDNGRGIPVGINHKAGLPAVEVVFTVLHAGGKFGGGGYKVSGGLHGVGASVVNALSDWLEVEICHEGKVYRQRYEKGHVVYKLKVVDECDPEKTGTKVTFLPDETIFEDTVFDYDTLKQRFREMAFLTKGLRISLTDLRDEEPKERVFHYEGGIKEFVQYLNRSKTPLYEQIIYCEGTKDNVEVEVAMQHNDSYTDNTYGFVNNITTPEGGTHVVGFRNAITKTFNDYARKNKLLKDSEPNLSGEDIREGLTAIISVKRILSLKDRPSRSSVTVKREVRLTVSSAASFRSSLNRILLLENQLLRSRLWRREQERRPERREILPEENPHWKACRCLESLQTVQTRIHPSVRSTS